MKSHVIASLSILLIVAAIVALLAGFVRTVDAELNPDDATEADEQARLEANHKFYAALNAMFLGDPEQPRPGSPS